MKKIKKHKKKKRKEKMKNINVVTEKNKNAHDEDIMIVKEKFKNVGVAMKRFFKLFGNFKWLICVSFLVVFTLGSVTYWLLNSKLLKSYDDYEEYFVEYKNILNCENDNYYVYFYSMECSHCSDLKTEIFKYLDSNKNDDKRGTCLYIMCIDNYLDDISSSVGEPENILGVSNYADLEIAGVPTLILVSNNVVQNGWSSPSKIKTQLLS